MKAKKRYRARSSTAVHSRRKSADAKNRGVMTIETATAWVEDDNSERIDLRALVDAQPWTSRGKTVVTQQTLERANRKPDEEATTAAKRGLVEVLNKQARGVEGCLETLSEWIRQLTAITVRVRGVAVSVNAQDLGRWFSEIVSRVGLADPASSIAIRACLRAFDQRWRASPETPLASLMNDSVYVVLFNLVSQRPAELARVCEQLRTAASDSEARLAEKSVNVLTAGPWTGKFHRLPKDLSRQLRQWKKEVAAMDLASIETRGAPKREITIQDKALVQEFLEKLRNVSPTVRNPKTRAYEELADAREERGETVPSYPTLKRLIDKVAGLMPAALSTE